MVKDYSKGKVYKIVCNITGQIYISSTCVDLLSHRLREHTYACKAYLTGKSKSNTSSYKIIIGGDYYIELVETYPCHSNDELTKREREFYDSYDCINTYRPFVYDYEVREGILICRLKHKDAKRETDAIYRANHKEEQREASKVRYLENKESVIERAKIHYENNREKVLERRKTQYEENKDLIKENRILNKEALSAKSKIYRDANRDRINVLKLANYHKNKKNKDTSDTPTI
jgi:hypothetical protein